jgi:hypothetical protein
MRASVLTVALFYFLILRPVLARMGIVFLLGIIVTVIREIIGIGV